MGKINFYRNAKNDLLSFCKPSNDDFVVVDYAQLAMENLPIVEVEYLINDISNKTKQVVIFSWEEFNYNNTNISYFIDNCLQLDIKIFIYSFNACVNEFLKIKYPSLYGNKIKANSVKTLFKHAFIIHWDKLVKPNDKNIKLLFLNNNRKINRDYIITILKNNGELYKDENFISFLNTLGNKKSYIEKYKDYSTNNGIDLDWLNELKLEPQLVNIHNQQKAQDDAQFLHHRAKFNIICEPFFGMSNDVTDYEYYNHTITRKTIYPLVYSNVIFAHSYNGLFGKILNEMGFETFFDNLDEFIKNMNDDFYYSKDVLDKIEHNKNTIFKHMGLFKSKWNRYQQHPNISCDRYLNDEINEFFQ